MRAFGEWPPGLRAVLAVAASCLLMVLVAWATLIGPDEVFTGAGRVQAPTTTTETCIPLPVATAADGSTTVEIPDDFAARNYCEPPPGFGGDDSGDVTEKAPPLWVGVLTRSPRSPRQQRVASRSWCGSLPWSLREVRARRLREEERTAVGFTVLDEPVRVARQVAADAGEQETLLREGDPRNAIVAAWHHFEVQGERAGVARRASETSSEYGLRILDLADGRQRLGEPPRRALPGGPVLRPPGHRGAPRTGARRPRRHPAQPRRWGHDPALRPLARACRQGGVGLAVAGFVVAVLVRHGAPAPAVRRVVGGRADDGVPRHRHPRRPRRGVAAGAAADGPGRRGLLRPPRALQPRAVRPAVRRRWPTGSWRSPAPATPTSARPSGASSPTPAGSRRPTSTAS